MPPKTHAKEIASKPIAIVPAPPSNGPTPAMVTLVVTDSPPTSSNKGTHERTLDVLPTSAVASPLVNTASRHATEHAEESYESPLKKLKKLHKRKVIDRIDDLRDFMASNDTKLPAERSTICIQARLLWIVPDVTAKGTPVLRVYLGEHQATEPLSQQIEEFQQAQREDLFEANQFLITLTIYEVELNDPNLPTPGTIISFTPTNMHLYKNCCQVDARLPGIKTIDAP